MDGYRPSLPIILLAILLGSGIGLIGGFLVGRFMLAPVLDHPPAPPGYEGTSDFIVGVSSAILGIPAGAIMGFSTLVAVVRRRQP
jgi:hypothetical protein